MYTTQIGKTPMHLDPTGNLITAEERSKLEHSDFNIYVVDGKAEFVYPYSGATAFVTSPIKEIIRSHNEYDSTVIITEDRKFSLSKIIEE